MPLARLRLAHNLPEADRHAFFDHTRCALRSRIPALQRALHCHHHAHRPGYAARPCCFAAAAAAAASGAVCRCRSDPKLAYRNRRPALAKPAAKATAVAPVHASGGRSARFGGAKCGWSGAGGEKGPLSPRCFLQLLHCKPAISALCLKPPNDQIIPHARPYPSLHRQESKDARACGLRQRVLVVERLQVPNLQLPARCSVCRVTDLADSV